VPENELLQQAENLFIRRWGEMAASWGVSRTMAEIHALLYLTTTPLCTDDVMDKLAVSRGSASTNLRELVNWGLIQRIHHRGDRKEYFEAERDTWVMFETITRERRRREVQPIEETIQKCLQMIDQPDSEHAGDLSPEAESYRQRLADLQEFFELMNNVFNLIVKAGHSGVRPLIKRLAKFVT